MGQGSDPQHPISPDGNFVWNGEQWVPNVPPPPLKVTPWYRKPWGLAAIGAVLIVALSLLNTLVRGAMDSTAADDPSSAAASSPPQTATPKPVIRAADLDRWWATNSDAERSDNCSTFRESEFKWWASMLEANPDTEMPKDAFTAFMSSHCTKGGKPKPLESPEPVESETPDPEAVLAASIDEALGEVTRVDDDDSPMLTDVKWKESSGVLTVTYRLSDNLFGNDVIIGAGWDDIKDIMAAVNASGLPVEELRVNGTFEMQDKYGKSLGEQTVMATEWDEETLQNIQPDNLDDDGMRDLATVVVIHPAFLE
jgi:hypothetical protein